MKALPSRKANIEKRRINGLIVTNLGRLRATNTDRDIELLNTLDARMRDLNTYEKEALERMENAKDHLERHGLKMFIKDLKSRYALLQKQYSQLAIAI